MQAAYDGHPLYTYVGDTAPGQAKGNGLNLSGGCGQRCPRPAARRRPEPVIGVRWPAGTERPGDGRLPEAHEVTEQRRPAVRARDGSRCGWPGAGCWSRRARFTLTCT